MDPLLLVAEWWWIAPTAVAAGTVGVMGIRRRNSTVSGRRLAVDAARHDLREAQLAAAWSGSGLTPPKTPAARALV